MGPEYHFRSDKYIFQCSSQSISKLSRTVSSNSTLFYYLLITCCLHIFSFASIVMVVRTFLQWDERREVLWDIVSPLAPQGLTGVRVKASSRKLQNAALADGKLRDNLWEANRLHVIYIVLEFRYTDSQNSKSLVHITQSRVCTSICKKRERYYAMQHMELMCVQQPNNK